MTDTINDTDDGRDPELEAQHADEMAQEEKRLASQRLDEKTQLVGKLLAPAIDRIAARVEKRERPIPTPWPTLNDALGGGLWPGLHVLTGTTGAGKTQFGLQVALRAAYAGSPTLYVALELSAEEVETRALALVMADERPEDGGLASPPHWSELYLGKSESGLRRAREIASDVKHPFRRLSLRIEEGDAYGWSASDLSGRVLGMRYRGELMAETPLVVLDYLQAVGPDPSQPGRVDLRERIGRAATEARRAAKKGAAVLLLSSVSREGAKLLAGKDRLHSQEGEPYDLVGLGKESGEIEYSADTVMALSRDAFDAQGTPMDLAVAKVRAGRTAWVPLTFNGSRFTERGFSDAPAKPSGRARSRYGEEEA